MEYDFEESRVMTEIRGRNAKKVLIQLPEGMKKEAFGILDSIGRNCNAEIVISGSSCWGGCDLAVDQAKKINADLLIHFGHAQFVRADFPVLYVELHSKLDAASLLRENIGKIDIEKIGLVGSVQYVKQFENIKKYLESIGKKVFIPKKKGFAAYDGHVVGCEYNSLKTIENEVDGFLVIGNKFHSLGAALMCVDKNVYLLNEQSNNLELMNDERNKVVRQRAVAIDKVKRANKIGIVVDNKIGQYNLKIAERLKNDLEKLGKEAMIIVVGEFSPGLMNFYDVDAFIDTACPRISIEDYGRYDKPIINSREASVVVGRRSWEELLEKGLIGFA
ncbi:diphthamide biosynthesis enzyme Dph2 [Candidatus Woesearchaeota archaeon]|nr:diphthamide biosynthesis enzyme Dph2 [Candidatus Woesearchaeota archaeon]